MLLASPGSQNCANLNILIHNKTLLRLVRITVFLEHGLLSQSYYFKATVTSILIHFREQRKNRHLLEQEKPPKERKKVLL